MVVARESNTHLSTLGLSILIMHFISTLLIAAAGAAAASCSGCNSFPPSMTEFSSGFRQPEPPMIKAEFEAQFIQHKW